MTSLLGIGAVTFKSPEPKFETKIIGKQIIGNKVRLIVQILGSDDQALINDSKIYISTRYNSLIFSNPTGESLPDPLYIKTRTIRYRDLIALENDTIDEIRRALLGPNNTDINSILYDHVLQYAIDNDIIVPYEVANADNEDEVSVSWYPKKIVAVWDEDEVNNTNYFTDSTNNEPGRAIGKTIYLEQSLEWPDSTVWLDYFVSGVIVIDFQHTEMNPKPELIFLNVGTPTGPRHIITLGIGEEGGITGTGNISGKSIEVTRESILAGETSDIIVRFKDSEGRYLDNPRVKFYIADPAITSIAAADIGTIEANIPFSEDKTIGGQSVIDKLAVIEYAKLESHNKSEATTATLGYFRGFYTITVKHEIEKLNRISYIDYKGVEREIYPTFYHSPTYSNPSPLSSIEGNIIYFKQDTRLAIYLYKFFTLAFLADSIVKVEYDRVTKDAGTSLGYDEETGFLSFGVSEAIEKITSIYYEDTEEYQLWGDERSYFVGDKVYMCPVADPYVAEKRLYVENNVVIRYSTRGIKATFTALTNEEIRAVILAVPILPDGTEDYANNQRTEIWVNKGKIQAILLKSDKVEYEQGEEIVMTANTVANSDDNLRYITIKAQKNGTYQPRLHPHYVGSGITIPSSQSAVFVAQSEASGPDLILFGDPLGFVDFVAYIKQGNDILYSNIVTILIHAPATNLESSLVQVLDRATRVPIHNAKFAYSRYPPPMPGGGERISYTNENGKTVLTNLTAGATYTTRISKYPYTPSWNDNYTDNDSLEVPLS